MAFEGPKFQETLQRIRMPDVDLETRVTAVVSSKYEKTTREFVQEPESNVVQKLFYTYRLMVRIKAFGELSDIHVSEWKSARGKPSTYSLQTTELQKELMLFCLADDFISSDKMSRYDPHPWVDLLLRTVRRLNIERENLLATSFKSHADALATAKKINILQRRLSRQLKGEALRDKRTTRLSNTNKNFKGLTAHATRLLANYKTLSVIRLDLRYRKFNVTGKDESAFNVDQEIAHRNQYIALLNKVKKSTQLVGFAWKMQHSSICGYFFHFVYYMTESRELNYLQNKELFERMWISVTNELGEVLDCSKSYFVQKQCGIGLVNWEKPTNSWSLVSRSSTVQRPSIYISWEGISSVQKLERLAAYMTKADYMLKLKLPTGYRTIGKSGRVPDKVSKKLSIRKRESKKQVREMTLGL